MDSPASVPVTPRKRSTFATLSIIFSSCFLLTPLFLGTIGGIVCGHLAMREIRRDPQLEGKQLAKWGLIIGYSSIVLIPLIILGYLFIFGGICG